MATFASEQPQQSAASVPSLLPPTLQPSTLPPAYPPTPPPAAAPKVKANWSDMSEVAMQVAKAGLDGEEGADRSAFGFDGAAAANSEAGSWPTDAGKVFEQGVKGAPSQTTHALLQSLPTPSRRKGRGGRGGAAQPTFAGVSAKTTVESGTGTSGPAANTKPTLEILWGDAAGSGPVGNGSAAGFASAAPWELPGSTGTPTPGQRGYREWLQARGSQAMQRTPKVGSTPGGSPMGSPTHSPLLSPTGGLATCAPTSGGCGAAMSPFFPGLAPQLPTGSGAFTPMAQMGQAMCGGDAPAFPQPPCGVPTYSDAAWGAMSDLQRMQAWFGMSGMDMSAMAAQQPVPMPPAMPTVVALPQPQQQLPMPSMPPMPALSLDTSCCQQAPLPPALSYAPPSTPCGTPLGTSPPTVMSTMGTAVPTPLSASVASPFPSPLPSPVATPTTDSRTFSLGITPLSSPQDLMSALMPQGSTMDGEAIAEQLRAAAAAVGDYED